MKVVRHDFLSLHKFDVHKWKRINQLMQIGFSDLLEILTLICMQNLHIKWLAEQFILSNSLIGKLVEIYGHFDVFFIH